MESKHWSLSGGSGATGCCWWSLAADGLPPAYFGLWYSSLIRVYSVQSCSVCCSKSCGRSQVRSGPDTQDFRYAEHWWVASYPTQTSPPISCHFTTLLVSQQQYGINSQRRLNHGLTNLALLVSWLQSQKWKQPLDFCLFQIVLKPFHGQIWMYETSLLYCATLVWQCSCIQFGDSL